MPIRNNKEFSFFTYHTPQGRITLLADACAILSLAFGEIDFPGNKNPNEVMNRCANEINEYLAGKRASFDIPIKLSGSDFQKSIWKVVRGIPYAQTRTTSEIAYSLGKPDSARMVGRALKENPLPILVPTHRVLTTSPSKLDKHLRNLEAK